MLFHSNNALIGLTQVDGNDLARANLRNADFDELGRTYKSSTFSVDPTSGSVSSNALVSQSLYNSRGMVMKSTSPGGMVSKSEFDGLGRTTANYLTDGGGDTGYGGSDDVTGDNVLSQAESTYDAGGRTILVTNREWFHDETGTGSLGTPTSGVTARVTCAAHYYHKADRNVASVDVGTNGGGSYTSPSTVPSRSDMVLVSETAYNASGWVETTTDPKGIVGKQSYDHAGRVAKSIENAAGRVPATSSSPLAHVSDELTESYLATAEDPLRDRCGSG